MAASSETKACIACAEDIKAQAALCKHCNTRQDDERFIIPKKRKSKLVTSKADCLKCQRLLKAGEHAVCMSCQFGLNKHEVELIKTGVAIDVCSVCGVGFYSPEISSECIKCEPRKSNSARFIVSWWVQLIFVFVAIINPRNEIFTSPGVFLATIGGTLFSTSFFLALVLGLVYVAQGRGHKRTGKIKDWLLSSAAFFILGLLLTIVGYSIAL